MSQSPGLLGTWSVWVGSGQSHELELSVCVCVGGQQWALPWPDRTPGPHESVALLAGLSRSVSGGHHADSSNALGGLHSGPHEPAAH